MHRSVRNGLAIASMAGGVFFLGQAVASADSNDAAASGDTTSITSSEGGGSADSTNEQHVNASNDVDNDADTGHIDAGGGTSAVGVVAGNGNEAVAGSDDGHVEASQTVHTEVVVVSEAHGGKVAGSNNASAGDGAGNDAAASGDVDSITEGGEGKHGGDATSDNYQDVNASNDVDNDADTGHIDAGGGTSAVGVVAGNGNEAVAGSDDGHVEASQTVHTGVVVVSEAHGGKVAGSNNASAGDGAGNDAAASGDVDSITEGGEGKHGGDATSDNYQDVNASNDVDNDADTGHIGAGGGESVIEVIAGNGNKLYCWSDEGDVTCTQNITTIITIISAANGGEVTCSNNASAGSSADWVCHQAPGQDSGQQPGQAPGQDSGQQPGQDSGQNPGQQPGQDSGQNPGQQPGQEPEQDAGQQPGQEPGQNAGQQPVAMPADHKHYHGHDADSPEHQKAVAPMHAVQAAPAAHRAPMSGASMRTAATTTAQPSGELAYTGSDVSAPLTLGLVALGLGGALTLAGRRRSSAAV